MCILGCVQRLGLGDIPCYVRPDMLLSKDMKMKIYSKPGLYSSD
jgi:hypothetical protein